MIAKKGSVFVWAGPFAITSVSDKTAKAYGCEKELKDFDPQLFCLGKYRKLQKLGEHINIMQEYRWRRGERLDKV